jgi:hypothetical protein
MSDQLEIFKDAGSDQRRTPLWSLRARRPYRPPYQKARIARMAYLAGLGCSAREIADEMGMSEQHVYRMLSDYRIALAPKAHGQKSVCLAISSKALTDAYELAGGLGMQPNWMMARALEALIAERTVLLNLLDGVKAPK